VSKPLLLDVSNFFLLLMVGFHLIDFVLLLCFHVCRIVAGIVYQFFLGREIHDVCADRVHEILRMGGDDKDVIVG
jgi:hypothetical protein